MCDAVRRKALEKKDAPFSATNCNLLRLYARAPHILTSGCGGVCARVFAIYSSAAAASARVFDMSKMFTKPFDKAINERMNE